MNERIKLLAEQAGWDEHHAKFDLRIEKFAELIVKECISIVEPTSHHQAFAQGYMGGVDGLELLYDKVKQIKENFGVKE